MSDVTVIETRSLSKRYGHFQAVASMNLDVRRGEVYGFLGRNGAGKTTTIRMLLGLIRPSSGCVRILDQPIGPRVLGRIGYLAESATAIPISQSARTSTSSGVSPGRHQRA